MKCHTNYVKVWQVLEGETKFIAKCAKVWKEVITKCGLCYKMWELLQSES